MYTITKPRWMLTTLLLVSLLSVTIAFPSYADSLHGEADFSVVDAYVESQMKNLKIPGLALVIIQGEQAVYMKGYGQAHPDGSPVMPQTSFMIGSTTKSFTALAVMQLVEAGKIELDAPVQTYIPWFRVADPQASAQITVRHLLNQTSGFSNASGHDDLAASDLSDDAIENSVRAMENVEQARAPGEAYEYSNLNYNILGLIVQIASGQSYESYIQENIYDPLEMSHSFTSQQEAMRNGMSTGYETFFGIPFEKEMPFNRGNISGGYLICSAEDLSHYLIAQLNEGRYGNVSVISPQGTATMQERTVTTETPGNFYGMGWENGSVNGVPTVWHDGENANYSTALMMVPQEKLGIVVLSNANGTFVAKATNQIATGVQAILRGKQPKSYARPLAFFVFVGSTGIPALLSLLWSCWMMVVVFVRRKKHPAPARRGIGWWIWVIGAPIFVDINMLVMMLVFILGQWGMSLNSMAAWYPDCFLMLFSSVILVAVWGVARTILTLRWAHSQSK